MWLLCRWQVFWWKVGQLKVFPVIKTLSSVAILQENLKFSVRSSLTCLLNFRSFFPIFFPDFSIMRFSFEYCEEISNL
jgi:hypothetical protein